MRDCEMQIMKWHEVQCQNWSQYCSVLLVSEFAQPIKYSSLRFLSAKLIAKNRCQGWDRRFMKVRTTETREILDENQIQFPAWNIAQTSKCEFLIWILFNKQAAAEEYCQLPNGSVGSTGFTVRKRFNNLIASQLNSHRHVVARIRHLRLATVAQWDSELWTITEQSVSIIASNRGPRCAKR